MTGRCNSSFKFQGRTRQKIADFDPNWAFPDCNSILGIYIRIYILFHALSSMTALLQTAVEFNACVSNFS